jgi:hypothetical protein
VVKEHLPPDGREDILLGCCRDTGRYGGLHSISQRCDLKPERQLELQSVVQVKQMLTHSASHKTLDKTRGQFLCNDKLPMTSATRM